MGQLLTSMASKSEPKDGQVLALIEGCFLGPSRVVKVRADNHKSIYALQ